MSAKHLENLYPITKRLCGEINPVGESNVDAVRLQNLLDTANLTELLVGDLLIAAECSNNYEASMKKIGEEAKKSLMRIKELINHNEI